MELVNDQKGGVNGMIRILRMNPVFKKVSDFRLRLVFNYEHFSVEKGGEIFQFVPTEGKEIIINLKSLQVENLGDIFIFQCETRYLRLPLYQLLLISDLHKHLNLIIEENVQVHQKDTHVSEEVSQEAMGLIEALENENRARMIDFSLETDDLVLFKKLTEGLQEI